MGTQTVRGGDATAASGFVGRGAICNDFVCVSSPAVERTIRQFVSDVEKQKDGVNTQMFAEGVEYSDDAFMSFRGREGFDGFRPSYVHGVEEGRGRAEGVVNKLEMNGTDSVRVEWKTKAQADVGGSIIVNFKTDVSLNLISGRITKMRLTWDTNGSDGLAAFGFNLRRRADSVSLRATRTAEWLQSIVDGDGGQNQPGNLSVDPRDPNKFFQQEDTNFQDAVFFCIGITLMYILVKALVILNS